MTDERTMERWMAHLRTQVAEARRLELEGADQREVDARKQGEFNAAVQSALPRTVFSGGCRSYYIDSNGRNSFSWPWSTDRMLAMLAHFDPADFLIIPATEEGAAA